MLPENPAEVCGSDADDREVGAVDAHHRTDGPAARAEAALPEVVAEDRHRVPAGHAILLLGEEAADGRPQPKHVEVGRGHHAAEDGEPSVRRADVHGRSRVMRGKPGKRARVLAVVEIVGIGEREGVDRRPRGNGLVDEHEPMCFGHRQGLKEDRLHEAQYGTVDAKAEGEGRDRRRGEPGRVLHPANRVAKVLPDRHQKPPCRDDACGRERAEPANRCAEETCCFERLEIRAQSGRWRSVRIPESDIRAGEALPGVSARASPALPMTYWPSGMAMSMTASSSAPR